MNIGVLGGGAREHALTWRLRCDGHTVRCYPGADAIEGSTGIDWANRAALLDGLKVNATDLIVIGPEAPLAQGVADALRAQGYAVLGPDQAAACLETSKAFAKQFMQRHKIPTAKYEVFESIGSAAAALQGRTQGCVLKLDGLAAGKGVYVCPTASSLEAALQELALRYPNNTRLLVEELLVGREVSILAVVAGCRAVLLPAAQDHKRLLDGDCGPNTGGMGAVCPVAWCTPALLEQIQTQLILPTVLGLQADNLGFRGILYFGVMVTADGPKLLEYNVRFGDPEAQAILPLVKGDLGALLMRAAAGELELPIEHAAVRDEYAVCVVLASREYPSAALSTQAIRGSRLTPPATGTLHDGLVFHAATKHANAQWDTNGGRVLSVVGIGNTLAAARQSAYLLAADIAFDGKQQRSDIGISAAPKRVAILFSGNGSNMLALLRAMRDGVLAGLAEPCLVLCNRVDAAGIAGASAAGASVCVLPSKGMHADAYDALLAETLIEAAADYVLLAGFMKIVGPRTLAAFCRRILNIHPADTALHQGLHGYEWALAQGRKETTVTVHYVDAGLDSGEVVSRTHVDLLGADSLQEVTARGLLVEHVAYARTFAQICLGNG